MTKHPWFNPVCVHAGGGVLCLGGLALTWLAIVEPGLAEREAADDARHAIVEFDATIQSQETELTRLGTELDAAREATRASRADLTSSGSATAVLLEVERAAGTLGLVVGGATSADPEHVGSFQRTPFAISGAGDSLAVIRLIETIPQSLPGLRIEGFELSGGGSAGVTFRIDFAGYAVRAGGG